MVYRIYLFMDCNIQENIINCKKSGFLNNICAWCLENSNYSCISYNPCINDLNNKFNTSNCITFDYDKSICDEVKVMNDISYFFIYVMILFFISLSLHIFLSLNDYYIHYYKKYKKSYIILLSLLNIIISFLLILLYNQTYMLKIFLYILCSSVVLILVTLTYKKLIKYINTKNRNFYNYHNSLVLNKELLFQNNI